MAVVITGSKEDQELFKQLRETHELYDQFCIEWEFFLNSYEGGKESVTGNIFKHQRENNADYKDRVKRAHPSNYCSTLVDFFTTFIFGETIERNGGVADPYYQSFLDDVNKKGEDITKFMSVVCTDMHIFGIVHVLVDTPYIEPEIRLTKAEEEERGIRPYWVIIRPLEVLDWDVDEFGIYKYFKRQQIVYERDIFGKKRKFEKYTEWFPNRIIITYIDVTNEAKAFVDTSKGVIIVPKWVEIPVVAFKFQESRKYGELGLSFLRDLAYNNRQVLNITSLIDEFLYRQCFNVLAMEKETGIPLFDAKESEFGTSNVISFPKGAKPPAYVSPPADPAKFLQDERQRIIFDMFKRAAQNLMSEFQNGEKSSGFSQAQSFSTTVPHIASRAETLEHGEYELMEKTFKLLGKTWKGVVHYKDRYEITNIADALTNLLIIFKDLVLPSETFAKEELKRIVHEFDGKLPPEVLNKVYVEIDKMNYDEWIEKVKSTKTSPAEQQKDKSTGTMKEVEEEAKVANIGGTKKVRGDK